MLIENYKKLKQNGKLGTLHLGSDDSRVYVSQVDLDEVGTAEFLNKAIYISPAMDDEGITELIELLRYIKL